MIKPRSGIDKVSVLIIATHRILDSLNIREHKAVPILSHLLHCGFILLTVYEFFYSAVIECVYKEYGDADEVAEEAGY